jgi:5-hydroxytryptamine receptor 1
VNKNVNFPTSTERVFITIPENLTADKRDPLLPQSPVHRHQPASAELLKSKRFKIHRLEVQAAFIMSANILPFSLCTFPVSCYAIALYWCLRLDGDCDTILLTWTYMWDWFMLHSIYNPVMFMSTSPEFWKALLRITRKWTSLFCRVGFHGEN